MASEITNSISFIDVAIGKKLFSVKTKGKNPEHVVFSPDGKWAYVSAEEAKQVDIIDIAKQKQVNAIDVGMRPRGMGFTADGKLAYVACELASKVYAIDAEKQKVIKEIAAGNFSNGVAVRPDGKRVFISNGKDGSVSVIDTATNEVIATVAVGKRPWNMAITPPTARSFTWPTADQIPSARSTRKPIRRSARFPSVSYRGAWQSADPRSDRRKAVAGDAQA